MKRSRPALDEIQRWMQAVITHPLGILPGVESVEAREQIDIGPEDLEQVIGRSRRLSSEERLAVYGSAYFSRLLECMRDFFPALVAALGEELFDEFAFHYLQQYPPGSYTLDRLADRFVDFLEETKPELVEASDEASWPDFLVDLARFEWTINQVFDGPGVEGETLLSAEQLQAIPADRWPASRLEPVVCLRLLEFRFPINEFFTAHREGRSPAIPQPGGSYMALTRRNFVVRRFPLSEPEYQLLDALCSGTTVGDAIDQLAQSTDDLDALAVNLQSWFRTWAQAGFFRRLLP